MSDKPITSVRFTPDLAAAARRIADLDNMSLSAWIRRIIDREITRREGACPTCGRAAEEKPADVP